MLTDRNGIRSKRVRFCFLSCSRPAEKEKENSPPRFPSRYPQRTFRRQNITFDVKWSPLGRQREPARETSGNARREGGSDELVGRNPIQGKTKRDFLVWEVFFFFCTICCITIVRIIIRYKRARNRHVTRNNARRVNTARSVLSPETTRSVDTP